MAPVAHFAALPRAAPSFVWISRASSERQSVLHGSPAFGRACAHDGLPRLFPAQSFPTASRRIGDVSARERRLLAAFSFSERASPDRHCCLGQILARIRSFWFRSLSTGCDWSLATQAAHASSARARIREVRGVALCRISRIGPSRLRTIKREHEWFLSHRPPLYADDSSNMEPRRPNSQSLCPLPLIVGGASRFSLQNWQAHPMFNGSSFSAGRLGLAAPCARLTDDLLPKPRMTGRPSVAGYTRT